MFFVHPEDAVNLDQMVESLARDGYLAAQEVLPDADQGDVRLFVLDGEALKVDGVYAAFRRVPAEGEARSNMRAGADWLMLPSRRAPSDLTISGRPEWLLSICWRRRFGP